MKSTLKVIFLLAIFATGLLAADWPQWQGVDRNAHSPEKGLLKEWPADGPRLAWRINGIGGGDSAPAVAKGKLFGLSNRDGKEIVWALDEANGNEIWAVPLGDAVEQRVPQSKEGPGGTPSIDGDRVYVIGMGGAVACLNLLDGKIIWQRSLMEDFGGAKPMWSFRESPLVDGNRVICTPGGSDATLVALDKLTGDTIWKSKVPAAAGESEAENDEPGRQASQRPQRNETNRNGRSNCRGSNSAIAGTKDPKLFVSEHWGMTEFSQKVPNGKYLTNLYFAETYQGITDAGQRVFSFSVNGKEYKDFDAWEKSGGARRAYIESVPVEVIDGKIHVAFSRQVENPAIKAIEIIPQSETKEAKAIRINAGASEAFTDSNGNEWKPDTGFKDGSVNPGTTSFSRGGFNGRRGFGRGPRAGAGYASVIPIDFEGRRQYVQLTASALVGVAASDGKFLWRYDRPANRMGINCSTPIFHEGLVFAASAYGNGGGAVKLEKSEGGTLKAEEVYFTSNMQNHHGGMIVHDGCLYGANGGNGGGFLSCLDFRTGKVLWRDRDAQKGALAFADERLYLRTEEGELMLIEPNAEKLVVRGRFQQPDRSDVPAWAHPVIANGKLYIRDQDILFCYDISAK